MALKSAAFVIFGSQIEVSNALAFANEELNMKLNWKLLTCVLLIGLFPALAFSQAEFSAAKRQFKRGIRSDKLADRRGAIRRMRSTNDPQGVKELLIQLHKARKAESKFNTKAKPYLKKLAKVRATIDERSSAYFARNPKATGIPAGLVGQLFKERQELVQKLGPIDKQIRLEASTQEMLKTAIGDLITGLNEEDQLAATNLFLNQYEKLRKPEQKALYLEILGYIHNPQAVIGLVGIAANAPKAAERVAALKALERLGDHRGGKAAKFALNDEQWQVRAAALEASRRFASIDMIPALIERLKVEDGRLKGDIIQTLSLLAGVSYEDNLALWQKWWDENETELRDIVKNLKSENASDQAMGLQKMEAHGFLLAARRILEKRQLTLAAVLAEESRRLVDPAPSKGESDKEANGEEVDDDELLAVGKTIAERDKQIRELAFRALVLDPFNMTWAPKKREELIMLMGYVGGKNAVNRLVGLMRKRDDSDKSSFESRMRRREKEGRIRAKWRYTPSERIFAIKALAHCAMGTPGEMEQLRKVFSDEQKDIPMMLAAVKAYLKIDTKQSVSALIRALGELTSQSENGRNKTAGVEKSIADALRTATKQTWGDSHDDWVTWWNEASSTYESEKEKAAKANPEGGEAAKNGGGTEFYGIKTYSKRIVFILDISGSMQEPAAYDGKTKIEVAKAELIRAISSLPKDAAFNIIFYSTDFEVWKKKLVVAQAKVKKEAKAYVASKNAGGGTNIYEPLVKVFDIAGRGSRDAGYAEVALDTIFFLSDGQPTAGRITNPEDILKKVLSLNSLRKIKIHTIGVGRGHDRQFMKLLADRSGGTYVAK